MKTCVRLFLLATMLSLLFTSLSCNRELSPATPNQTPHTRLANIPRDGDTVFALVTLHWDGYDFDGFIAGYQYKYVTIHVGPGDSVVHDWQGTIETGLTIPFVSDSALNKQIFSVRAIDNNGSPSDTPATRIFFTRRAVPPVTRIVTPSRNAPSREYFVISQITDWWQGIRMVIGADDPDGATVVGYAWAIDSGPWHWMTDTVVHIPPSEFSSLTGTHLLRAISRDNTNLIDPVGDTMSIQLVNPTFTKRVLIIDETDETTFPAGMRYTDAQIDSFYSAIFGTTDSWDYFANAKKIPPRSTLGQYRLIVWHADNRPITAETAHFLRNHADVLQDYLDVGGKLFMSGWRILKSFRWNDPFPVGFEPGTFVFDYLHIVSADETILNGDFTFAQGYGGLSDVAVDSVKLANVFPYSGKLAQINFMGEQNIGGFAKKAFLYQNAGNSTYFRYRGQTCGIIYYGTSFDVVVLGFPMFFMNGNDSQRMVNEILLRLGM